MIKCTIQDKIYNIPTNFDEISYKDYCQLKECNPIKKVSIVTGIELPILEAMDITDLISILEHLTYLDITFVAENLTTEIEPLQVDIGKSTYGQLEMARQLINNKGWVNAANDVLMIYNQEQIQDSLMPVAMAHAHDIYTKINNFLENYKPLFESEIELEEELAGAEVFKKFGNFPTVDKYAIEYGLTHNEVLAMQAEIVYTKMLYELEKKDYETKLMKIKGV